MITSLFSHIWVTYQCFNESRWTLTFLVSLDRQSSRQRRTTQQLVTSDNLSVLCEKLRDQTHSRRVHLFEACVHELSEVDNCICSIKCPNLTTIYSTEQVADVTNPSVLLPNISLGTGICRCCFFIFLLLILSVLYYVSSWFVEHIFLYHGCFIIYRHEIDTKSKKDIIFIIAQNLCSNGLHMYYLPMYLK